MLDMFGNICEYDDYAIDPKKQITDSKTYEERKKEYIEFFNKLMEAHKDDPPMTSMEIVEQWGKLLKH